MVACRSCSKHEKLSVIDVFFFFCFFGNLLWVSGGASAAHTTAAPRVGVLQGPPLQLSEQESFTQHLEELHIAQTYSNHSLLVRAGLDGWLL